eukprot:7356187-Prorocentrum_lima.AAC.1
MGSFRRGEVAQFGYTSPRPLPSSNGRYFSQKPQRIHSKTAHFARKCRQQPLVIRHGGPSQPIPSLADFSIICLKCMCA